MWIYSWCSSRDIHGQNHLTEVFFVSRCGSTLGALQETYMFNLTAHFSYVCSEVTRHDQTHFTLQWIVQSVWSLEFLWADVDLLLMLFKRHTCSNSLHTSVKCAVRSPDMIKLTSHFKISVQWVWSLDFFVSRCGSTFVALQETYMFKLTSHFKISVQWVWSLDFFVSRCGSTFVALQETYMFKLTAHLRSLCSEFGHSKFCEQMWIYFWGPSRDRHGQTHCTLQFSVQ